MNRRRFLQNAAGTTGLLAVGSRALGANEKVVVGVMGVSRNDKGGDGRGAHLAATFAGLPNVEVAYVCDVDERNVGKAIESVSKKGKPPQGLRDFRKILDDKTVDALVIAAPDHWHAPAAILACAAGKHVYVEKPCSHNAREGELLLEAARKHNRKVQHGTQRRSWPGIQEAMAKLKEGAIGKVLSAKCWYFNGRPSIGAGKAAAVPSWLDWSLWQGPAPERDYRDNFVHYNWHWFWHWGTSELGNNGVHTIDLARWGLGVDYPTRIVSAGGKYRHDDDDQETPDTNIVTFEFPAASITWEGRSWMKRGPLDPDYEVAFYGQHGTLVIRGPGYAIHGTDGKEESKGSGAAGDAVHLQNFVDAVRDGRKLNAEIEQGFQSTLLCHLGNIAFRTSRAVQFDPKGQRIINDRPQALWGREYRKGWEPKV